jgi:hypothetical protein
VKLTAHLRLVPKLGIRGATPPLHIYLHGEEHRDVTPYDKTSHAVLSLGVKQPGREADHSPPTSAEVKNTWIYNPLPYMSPWRGA